MGVLYIVWLILVLCLTNDLEIFHPTPLHFFIKKKRLFNRLEHTLVQNLTIGY